MSLSFPTQSDATVPVYSIHDLDTIDPDQLSKCAELFSANYAVWAENVSRPLRPGNNIRMSAQKLRSLCTGGSLGDSVVVTAHVNGTELVGHAIATRWRYGDGYAGWVTQLVVAKPWRMRHIATNLVQQLMQGSWWDGIKVMGIISSHPVSCTVLCKLIDGDTSTISLSFIRDNVTSVLSSSPVPYVRDAKLRGALAPGDLQNGTSYEVFTDFWIDHTEPKDALRVFNDNKRWGLGQLSEGHEFLVLIPISPGL